MEKIRVVLIEDHELTRVGLKATLQQTDKVQVVGEAANAAQGLRVLEHLRPDVAIVDIGLPDTDGIELTRQYRQAARDADRPLPRVLILTMHDDEDAVLAAFAAGADSYSIKDVSVDRLFEAIRITHGGDSWVDPAIARIVLQQARKTPAAVLEGAAVSGNGIAAGDATPPIEPLTERELEVLEAIVAGCSNAEIAEQLYITVGTVKTHVRSILNKLCADDRTQAAVKALRSGLVD